MFWIHCEITVLFHNFQHFAITVSLESVSLKMTQRHRLNLFAIWPNSIRLDSIRFDFNVNWCIHFSRLHIKPAKPVSDWLCKISTPFKVLFVCACENIETHTPSCYRHNGGRRAIVRFYFETFHPYIIPSFKVYLVFFCLLLVFCAEKRKNCSRGEFKKKVTRYIFIAKI